MRGLMRGLALTVMGFVASYAMKKVMSSVQKQAEAARQQANTSRPESSVKDLKTLKQDPQTGVYYAED